MAIYFSGTFGRSGGEVSAITKQLKLINLKLLKKIEVQFDPFHPKAVIPREFLFHINSPTVKATNLNCSIKTNIVCDRSAPWIRAEFLDTGNSVRFLADKLSVLEIFQYFNKNISSLVPKEDVSTQSTQLAKLAKKSKRK